MATQMQALYTGRSGHLVVVAEFLRRGYNAAIPEVDRGDDIFVVEDASGRLSRVQVKAALGRGKGRHYAQYQLSVAQLRRQHTPELHYVFAICYDALWRDFLVISREDLYVKQNLHGLGTVKADSLYLRLSFGPGDVLCKGIDLQPFRCNWSNWPEIQH
jgi:hypothetical protein